MERTEIYINGKYLLNNPTWDEADAVWKAACIDALLKKNKIKFNDVTEVGCGSGKILELISERYPGVSKFCGYDISPQAIAIAKKISSSRIMFYENDFLQTDPHEVDLLLLIDVIEHVEDYYGFLSQLKSKASKFVFHIPLDLSCRTVLKPHVLLQQRESVGHIHYFTREMVLWMLKDTGYSVIDWIYTKPVSDVKQQKTVKGKIKKMLRNFSFLLNKNRSADLWGNYSMMILAE
jgi:SAM-dependent methyltransferase